MNRKNKKQKQTDEVKKQRQKMLKPGSTLSVYERFVLFARLNLANVLISTDKYLLCTCIPLSYLWLRTLG